MRAAVPSPATFPAARRPDGTRGRAPVPDAVHETLRSTGQPLDPDVRADLEPRFGVDLSRVRVHADAQASASAAAVSARAYTVGRDIVFGRGAYAPGTDR